MKISAEHKNARMTPRKVRQLREVVVGLGVTDAKHQLAFQKGKGAKLVSSVLNSAIANAEHNYELSTDNLKVAAVDVGEGIKLKRFQPVSRGMAHSFVKKSSHIRVVLEQIKESKKELKGKKTEIDTITASDYATGKKAEEKTQDVKKEKSTAKAIKKSHAKEEATSKIKTQQQGGDKKTSPRKSK